jgi:hypothetical protein
MIWPRWLLIPLNTDDCTASVSVIAYGQQSLGRRLPQREKNKATIAGGFFG